MKNGTFEDSDGNIEWWFNGNLHREYGPAVVWANGDKAWYVNGLQHREDGPALVCANGHKEWWIAGQEFKKNEFQHWLDKKNLHIKLEENLEPKPILKRTKI